MSKVTVAIPTYNREEYLKDSIKSVLNQSFSDFEIIIFDNASNYNINRLITSFNDTRITCIRNEENIGNLNNFRKVFNYKYDSEYLVVFHDDDVMHPKMLETEIRAMEKNKNISIVGSKLSFVHNHDLIFQFNELKNDKIFNVIDYKDVIRLVLKDFDLCFDSVMYRVSCLKDIYDYEGIYFKWCDRPFVIDIAKKGGAVILNEKLVNYRIHKGQDSQTENKNYLDNLFNLHNYYRSNLLDTPHNYDHKIFYRHSTNTLLLSLIMFCDNFTDYFNLIKIAIKKELFFFKYINVRGCFYFLKAVIILLKK